MEKAIAPAERARMRLADVRSSGVWCEAGMCCFTNQEAAYACRITKVAIARMYSAAETAKKPTKVICMDKRVPMT